MSTHDDCCGTHPVNMKHGDHDDRHYSVSSTNEIKGSDPISKSDLPIMIGECILDEHGGCKRSEQYGSKCCSSGPQFNEIIEEEQDDDNEMDSCCGDCKTGVSSVKTDGCGDADSCCGRDEDNLDTASCEGSGCCADKADTKAMSCCEGENDEQCCKPKDSCCDDGESCCGGDEAKSDTDSCGGTGCCGDKAVIQAESCCGDKYSEECGEPKDSCCSDCKAEDNTAELNDCGGDSSSCCGRDEAKVNVDSRGSSRGCENKADGQAESFCSGENNGKCDKLKDSCCSDCTAGDNIAKLNECGGDTDSCCQDEVKLDIDSCGSAGCCDDKPDLQEDSRHNTRNEELLYKPPKAGNCCGSATNTSERPSTQVKPKSTKKDNCCTRSEQLLTQVKPDNIPGCCAKKRLSKSEAPRKKRCCSDKNKSASEL